MSSIRPEQISTVSAPLRSLLSRDSLIVVGALVGAAILAWAWLISLPMAGGSMAEMNIGPEPLSPAYLIPTFLMWAIMMVAMMVPSAAPMILLHARIDKSPSARARTLHSFLFALAYLLVWTAFSAVVTFVQGLLVGPGIVSAATLTLGSRTIAAGLLAIAAGYELTAAKRLCLEKCQSPMIFMLQQFQPGGRGAFRLGVKHGLYCLGCCWALMLLLFVAGVMNLAWVAVLGTVILGEKFAPAAWQANRFVAAGLFIAAVVLLID